MDRFIWRSPWWQKFNRNLLVGCILCLTFTLTGGVSAETGAEILQRVDASRAIRPQFAFEMEITAYRSGEEIDRYKLAGYVRIEETKAQTLLYFGPAKDTRAEDADARDEIWMHFPKTKNVIKLSPMQILLGEVANGDLYKWVFPPLINAAFCRTVILRTIGVCC